MGVNKDSILTDGLSAGSLYTFKSKLSIILLQVIFKVTVQLLKLFSSQSGKLAQMLPIVLWIAETSESDFNHNRGE
jgi:hypothetical protein